jgi:hypothetical protein
MRQYKAHVYATIVALFVSLLCCGSVAYVVIDPFGQIWNFYEGMGLIPTASPTETADACGVCEDGSESMCCEGGAWENECGTNLSHSFEEGWQQCNPSTPTVEPTETATNEPTVTATATLEREVRITLTVNGEEMSEGGEIPLDSEVCLTIHEQNVSVHGEPSLDLTKSSLWWLYPQETCDFAIELANRWGPEFTLVSYRFEDPSDVIETTRQVEGIYSFSFVDSFVWTGWGGVGRIEEPGTHYMLYGDEVGIQIKSGDAAQIFSADGGHVLLGSEGITFINPSEDMEYWDGKVEVYLYRSGSDQPEVYTFWFGSAGTTQEAVDREEQQTILHCDAGIYKHRNQFGLDAITFSCAPIEDGELIGSVYAPSRSYARAEALRIIIEKYPDWEMSLGETMGGCWLYEEDFDGVFCSFTFYISPKQ